ncbi:MAG: hypothetical protein IPQ07_30910 [Myxococcales bacterium]|nr:hypothetical protein [Myxococcales bacterium]
MLRLEILATLLLVVLTGTAAAAPDAPDDLATTLQRAIDLAGGGRCDEALALTRALATADQAFYVANVPAQPALAACVRERIARPAPPAPPPRATTHTAGDDDPSVLGNLLIAGGAGTAGFFAFGLLANKIAYGRIDGGGDDEGLPSGEFVIASSIGSTLLPAAAVYLMNRDDRHDSSLAMTVTGSVVFGLVGTVVGYPMVVDSPLLGLAVIIGTPAVGAVVGNRLSRSLKRLPVEVVPMAAPGQFGAIVGGRF